MFNKDEIKTLKNYAAKEFDNVSLESKKVQTVPKLKAAYEARLEFLEGIIEKLEDMEKEI